MRIAMIASGHPRTFKETSKLLLSNFRFSNLERLDFYLHFYTSDHDQDVLDTYKPIDWICEKETSKTYPLFPFKDPPNWATVENYKCRVVSQFKNIGIAFSLIPKNYYDVVVRFRYDIQLKSQFEFSTLDMEKFNIPSGEDYGGINDRFCISNYDNMEHYCSLYKNMLKYGADKFHPESMLSSHLSGKPIHRFDCNINEILR